MDRPDLYVVARFLEIMYKSGSPMKKTNIQMLLGLNYPRFTEYLEWLLSRQLVSRTVDEEGGERIELTPRGLEAYYKLVGWIKEMIEGIRI